MLMEFLEKTASIGGDSLEIEHRDGREEITAFFGNVGFGIGLLEGKEAKSLFKEMDELKKAKRATLQDVTYRLEFSRFESFGEWVYQIHIKKMDGTSQPTRQRSHAKRGKPR